MLQLIGIVALPALLSILSVFCVVHGYMKLAADRRGIGLIAIGFILGLINAFLISHAFFIIRESALYPL